MIAITAATAGSDYEHAHLHVGTSVSVDRDRVRQLPLDAVLHGTRPRPNSIPGRAGPILAPAVPVLRFIEPCLPSPTEMNPSSPGRDTSLDDVRKEGVHGPAE